MIKGSDNKRRKEKKILLFFLFVLQNLYFEIVC